MDFLVYLFLGRKNEFEEGKAYKNFFMVNFLSLMYIFFHVLYFFFFAFFSQSAKLAVLQGFAVISCSIAYYCNRIFQIKIASQILFYQILFIGLIWTVFFGLSYHFYFLILTGLIPQFFITEIHKKQRWFLSLISLLGLNINFIIGINYKPLITLPHSDIFSMIFTNLTFLFILGEIILYTVANKHADSLYKINLQNLKDDSMRDPLTLLYNRRYFQSKENEITENASITPHCIVLLDLDHFKNINDSYSHEVGDLVLRHFADLMLANFRKTDIILRWGGEEFVIILTDVTLEKAALSLENFRKLIINSPLRYGDISIYFTFTAGISQIDQKEPLEYYINLADSRMYKGKRQGRNQIVII